MTRIALLQMTSGIDPVANANVLGDAVKDAARDGGVMLFTPEMSGLLDRNRKRAAQSIVPEEQDLALTSVRDAAAKAGIWVNIGSIAIATADGYWVNRGFVIDSSGNIVVRYDKIHMFDVDLPDGGKWHESSAYKAGDNVVTLKTPIGILGLAICYDIRFPALFDALGRMKCDVISIPSAFTVPTGKAHWHILQRARAIEASAYVVSAAQTGQHEDGRATYGHSLVVDPWGDVTLDLGGDFTGLGFADIDTARIAEVRSQLPSLDNRRVLPISN